jgi:hypothetical protein
VRIAELVSLLALRIRANEPELTAEITEWLVKFVGAQPGITRPLGDRYAVSVVPVVSLLLAEHRSEVEDLLRKVTVWVCDRYERDELGLGRRRRLRV